jgi:hypothetical protein
MRSRSTATEASPNERRRSRASRPARSGSSSRRTLPRAVSISRICPTSSTSSCRGIRRTTSTASAGQGGPEPRAMRSASSASTRRTCCVASSDYSGRRSPGPSKRASSRIATPSRNLCGAVVTLLAAAAVADRAITTRVGSRFDDRPASRAARDPRVRASARTPPGRAPGPRMASTDLRSPLSPRTLPSLRLRLMRRLRPGVHPRTIP